MASEQSTTLKERPERTLINADLIATDLVEIVFALAALNSEVSANLSKEEIDIARSGLTWVALDKARKLQEFFQ